jgi:HPt (histidine-containing phosphotransfer) domain-containing protein
MAFSAYSVKKAVQGNAQLAAIKDLYFPVLQRLDANIVRVDKLEETYIQVVIAGDRDVLEKATALGEETDKAFAEITTLYPGHETQATIATLRTDLKQYQELATKVSLAFLAQSSEDATPMTTRMNETLDALKKGLTAFRASSYGAFVQTLNQSQRDAQMRLYMGLALGVMNLGFMAVLVFFIRNNMKMMTIIAVQNATLEDRVAERTAQLSQKTNDINAMLQNMKLGVSTVVPGNRIHPEFSSYLKTIFGTDDLAGNDLVQTLFAQSSLGVDAKDQITVALGAILGEDAMMFDFNSHLLAREMTLNTGDSPKIVQMDWSPIVGEDGTVDKVLLISQDVTQLRELEASSASQRDELDIISKLIRTPVGKFNSFMESSLGYVAENRRLIDASSGNDPTTIAALFRNMHTIKGNARTFEFTHVTNAAHAAEQTYDQLRKDSTTPWDTEQLRRELEAVHAALVRYQQVNDETLGRKGRASDLLTDRGAFVSHDQLASLRAMTSKVEKGATDEELAALRRTIDQLGLVSLSRIISGAGDAIGSLATELGKPVPAIDLVNGDTNVTPKFAETFKNCLMHLLRNSLDHGIESPADRARANKPERGTIRFVGNREADHLELRIGDDGRGLALPRLFDKAMTEGVFRADHRPDRVTVAELIFRSGLSTAAQVTEVSGRGVGLDAVRTFLAEHGATIRVDLPRPTATDLDVVPFEFVIRIPSSAIGH